MADKFPYRLYGGATRPDAISGMDPRFQLALTQLYAAAPPEVQQQLGLTSGYRSVARQQQLWDASDKSGKMVARPGHSKHNFGTAADLYGMGTGGGKASPEAQAWVHQNAPKYGLAFPMSYEPWHVQLAGGGAAPTAAPSPPNLPLVMDGPKGQEQLVPQGSSARPGGPVEAAGGGAGSDTPAAAPSAPAAPAEPAAATWWQTLAKNIGKMGATGGIGDLQPARGGAPIQQAARIDQPEVATIDPQQAEGQRQQLAMLMQRLNSGRLF